MPLDELRVDAGHVDLAQVHVRATGARRSSGRSRAAGPVGGEAERAHRVRGQPRDQARALAALVRSARPVRRRTSPARAEQRPGLVVAVDPGPAGIRLRADDAGRRPSCTPPAAGRGRPAPTRAAHSCTSPRRSPISAGRAAQRDVRAVSTPGRRRRRSGAWPISCGPPRGRRRAGPGACHVRSRRRRRDRHDRYARRQRRAPPLAGTPRS